MRILVTNDDGIDSVGLHVLARAVRHHGEVVIVAPDGEYSGAGASIGAFHLLQPDVHTAEVDGIDESWSVAGPPALCVMFARLGVFGGPFDLVVSGINPGSNVGRSVYHSGTVGAATTARSGGISGVAVSQAVEAWGVEGQGWDEMLLKQQWESAGRVAAEVVGAVIERPPSRPEVINVNVPNLPLDEIKGWRFTEVGGEPPRAMAEAHLVAKPGHQGGYRVEMSWGEPVVLPPHTDGGAVMHDEVSISWLSRLEHDTPEDDAPVAKALDSLIGPASR